MDFGGALFDTKGNRDLAVRASGRNEVEHLPLSWGYTVRHVASPARSLLGEYREGNLKNP